MTDGERLAKLEALQEDTRIGVHRLMDVLETYKDHLLEVKEALGEVRDDVAAIRAWADEPPSGDLSDVLRGLVLAVSGLHEAVEAMPGRVAEEVGAGR